ncbi:3-hexulose-6-phosphate synthase [Thalassobacillus pellis]|uniref:3-hexulose-6-phosphate synthase n=1 Tax=Thalassobacillus pellis TaxID=748008 RepID=UPI00195F8DA9|nr:3-hexulose-6-phosphate synthase [Thalassobacillus pellis]MBM7552015.1 3-hexulose-6-phosphate synthase [Thalassobacillus pellis]
MNLQLALDRLTKEECFGILKETSDNIDWIEIGTGIIKEYGMELTRQIKKTYPDKTLVADMKTCDAGRAEATQAFEAGADIMTVMAFAADKTISDTLEAAREHNKRVMVDLLGVTNKQRIEQLRSLGVNLVSIHFGKDMQETGTMGKEVFSLVEDTHAMEIAVAGGINLQSLPEVLVYQPDTVIVGSAITKQKDRQKAARELKEVMRDHEKGN